MTLASAGKALVFHYNTAAKTVISSVSLSSPLISSVSLPFAALLVFPAFTHLDTVGFSMIYCQEFWYFTVACR